MMELRQRPSILGSRLRSNRSHRPAWRVTLEERGLGRRRSSSACRPSANWRWSQSRALSSSRRMRPRLITRLLQCATGILRDLYSLLLILEFEGLQHNRLRVDTHDLVTLLHNHALGSQDNLLAIQKEPGLLAIDALDGQTII